MSMFESHFMRSIRPALLAAWVPLLLAGCPEEPELSAGRDAAPDDAGHAVRDAAADAGRDASTETDAGALDAGRDASAARSCDDRPPPPSLTRAASILADRIADATLYEQVFRGRFPGSLGNVQQVRIRRGEYAAMRFTTGPSWPAVNAAGHIETAVLQPAYPDTRSTGTARMWSISPCPGDFRKEVLDAEMGPGCVKGGLTLVGQGFFRFGGAAFEADPNRCALQPDTTYYLNLVYTDQDPSTVSHDDIVSVCPDQFCGNSMVPRSTVDGWE